MNDIACVQDLENHAYKVLPKHVLDYYKSGALSEQTLKLNRSAFSEYAKNIIDVPITYLSAELYAKCEISSTKNTKTRRLATVMNSIKQIKSNIMTLENQKPCALYGTNHLRIRPKFLRDVTDRDLSVTIMGEKVAMPIGVAPTAMQRMAHPDGECATARAAQEKGIIYILSTISTTSLEEIERVAPKAIKWFQLYVYKNREITKQLIRRAEKAGFKAIVLTVDAPVFGLRLWDVRNNFSMPSHLKLANFQDIDTREFGKDIVGSGINQYVSKSFDTSLTWDDLKWLQSLTKLPILLKGVLTAEDAVKAADMGVAGVLVSNHGARQIDSAPASIEALPEIVKAVGHRIDVFVDGGFREGVDIFKALTLGAKMVFIGRPILWGLSYDGEKGVKKVLDILENELDNAFALTGCTSVNDISRDMVVHKSYYSRL